MSPDRRRASLLIPRALAVPLLLASPRAAQDAAPAADAAPTTMLHLRSGDVLFGTILGHDPDGLSFRRLETGGQLALPWSFLDPTEAAGMRLRFGYVEAEAEELLVDAERLELADGTEVVGRIVNRTETHLWVKRAEGTIPIAKTSVRGPAAGVRVPALDIFTREELYQQRTFELQGRLAQEGRAGAEAHDELARYAERLLDYGHALEYYRAVASLDPSYESARIAQAIARAEEKAAQQQQVEYLSQIELFRARKRYDKALEALQSFPNLFKDSPLLEDWNALRERVFKSQERDLRDLIVSRWHHWSVRLARDAARKKTYEEVLGYLDEKMSEEVVEHVRSDAQTIAPGIEPDQVRRLWNERKSPYHQASYGLGTWLLGEAARKELDEKKDGQEKDPNATPAPGSQAEARKKLEERVKRYLENQKLARKGEEQVESKDEDPQVFWQGWDSAGRSQWILAYYAEKSGDFRDLQPRLSNCRECGGTGARDWLFTGAAIANQAAAQTLVPCPTCHTIGVVRRIRYR